MTPKSAPKGSVAVKGSDVHGRGVFVKERIPRGVRVLEYLGEKVSKKEADARSDEQMAKAQKGSCGAVYLFELNSRYYLDGNISGNPAKYINHSCSSNCRFELDKGRVWVISKKTLLPGDELSIDYGFDVEVHEDHPCLCGSDNCVGFIVAYDQRRKLQRLRKKMLTSALGN